MTSEDAIAAFNRLGHAAKNAGVTIGGWSITEMEGGTLFCPVRSPCAACDSGMILADGGSRPCLLCSQHLLSGPTYAIGGPTEPPPEADG